MKYIKKYAAAFLALIMVITAFPTSAFADVINIDADASGHNEYCDWSYTKENKTLYIDTNGVLTSDDTQRLPLYNEDGSYWNYIGWKTIVFGRNITKIEGIKVNEVRGFKALNVVFEEGSECTELGEYLFYSSYIVSINIPEKLEVINDHCFANAFRIESTEPVVFPSTLRYIGESAFNESVFKSMIIPDYTGEGVRTIGDYAFANTDFEKLTLGTGIEIIPKGCFADSTVKYLEIPEGVTTIDKYAFRYCDSLVSVSLPHSIENINQEAFTYSTINSIEFPDNSKTITIGSEAFKSCSKLTTVVFPNSLDTKIIIDTAAFKYNSGIVNLTITASVASLGDNAFQSAIKLRNLTFEAIETPDGYVGLEKIGCYAFRDSNVKNVTFCESIKTIDKEAFTSCTNIEEITLPESLERIDWQVFAYTNLKEIVVPKNVNYIGEGAFGSCKRLVSADLSQCVNITTGMQRYIFNGDVSLTDVKLPPNIEKIRSGIFSNCVSLDSVDLPDSLTTIEESAFAGSTIDNISLPPSVSTIQQSAFSGTPITVIDLSKCKNLKVISQGTFQNCTNLKTVTLPSGITKIGQNAFRNTALSEIKMKSVCVIGDSAFRNTKLRSIVIPDNCYEIDGYAFADNTELKYIELPEAIKTIKAKAFSGTSLDTFVMKSTKPTAATIENAFVLEQVANTTFMGCAGSTLQDFTTANELTFVAVDGTSEEPEYSDRGTCDNGSWKIRTVEDAVVMTIEADGAIGNNIFVDSQGNTATAAEIISAYNVTKVVFDDGISDIADNMFYTNGVSTASVKEIVLPNSVTKIGANAFRQMEGLEKINIPVFVKEIGEYAFAYCSSLDVKLSPTTALKEIKEGTFYATAITDITVPIRVTKIGKAAFGANTSDAQSVKLYIPNRTTSIYSDNSNKADNAIGYTANGAVDDRTVIVINKASAAYNYATENGFEWSYPDGSARPHGYFYSADSNDVWAYDEASKSVIIDAYATPDMNGSNYYYPNGELVKNTDFDVDAVILDGAVSIKSGGTGLFAVFNPKYVYLPDTLKTVGKNAFADCTKLRALEFPDSVTTLEEGIFKDIFSLASVKFGKGIRFIPNNLMKNSPALKYVDFSDSLVEIGSNAFAYCKMLQEIIIPDSVLVVNSSAFYNCSMVQKLVVGKGVRTIYYGAFSLLRTCNDVECNFSYNNVESTSYQMCYYAFMYLGDMTGGVNVKFNGSAARLDYFENVKNIYIGKNVSSVTLSKNSQLLNVESFTVDKDNTYLYEYGGCLYSSRNNKLLWASNSQESIQIKEGTTSIADYAFHHTKAHTIKMPDSVTSIGDCAFYRSDELRKITLSKSLTEIPTCAFYYCTNLRTIELPSGIETIGRNAFNCCLSLSSVILNDGLKRIDDGAFHSCKSLECIVIPESVESIGSRAFCGTVNLKDIFIWNATLDDPEEVICHSNGDLKIHTLVASPAYEYARENLINYDAYTDEDAFFDDCEMMKDIYLGYFGMCTYGHGDIDYLTVYEPTCTEDGYIIGVCEYCSVILEEIHTNASGHDYKLTADIPATDVTRGIKAYTCENCGNVYRDITEPMEDEVVATTHTVSGYVAVAADKAASKGTIPVKNVSVVINNQEVAVTDNNGYFSFEIETGVYELELRHTYGFTRKVYVAVSADISIEEPIALITCDFNRDGVIDDLDIYLLRVVISSSVNDAGYLDFVDLNNDGRIDVRDAILVNHVKGNDASQFSYPSLVIMA